MKKLLDKIHSIIDTLEIIIQSDVRKIYSPNYDHNYTPEFFGHITDIK